MQWNAQSLLSNRHLLTKFIYDNDIDIAVISETWLKPHMSLKIKGYDIIRNDCGNDHNGVAIIISKRINYNSINTNFDDSLQNLAVQVKINNKLLSIVSIYCPNNSTPRFHIKKFKDLISSLPKPVYAAGDFNAHHTIWGCHSVDARGREILDCLEECDLVLLNDAQPTTVGTNSWKPNGLDLTLVSPSIALNCDWFVNDDPLGSYHLPTITSIQFFHQHSPLSSQSSHYASDASNLPVHVNFRLVNWEYYTKLVNDNLRNFVVDSDDPLNSYFEFCKLLKSAIDLSVPSK